MSRRMRSRRFTILGVLIAIAFALTAGLASAIGTLDQRNPGPTNSNFVECGTTRLAQTFTAARTGLLDTVKLGIAGIGEPGDVVVSIEGTDSLSHPGVPDDQDVLATETIAQSDVGTSLDNVQTVGFHDPPPVEADKTYAIVVAVPYCGTSELFSGLGWYYTSGDSYPRGEFCVSAPWQCELGEFGVDLIFATYVTPRPSADVAVNMTGPASAKKGVQVTYVISVSNAGPDTAHNVVLRDPIPTGVSALGVTTTKGTCTPPGRGGTISCALGDLAAGSSGVSSVSVKVTARAGSTIANVVSANSTADGAGTATPDPQPSNNAASLSTIVTK